MRYKNQQELDEYFRMLVEFGDYDDFSPSSISVVGRNLGLEYYAPSEADRIIKAVDRKYMTDLEELDQNMFFTVKEDSLEDSICELGKIQANIALIKKKIKHGVKHGEYEILNIENVLTEKELKSAINCLD